MKSNATLLLTCALAALLSTACLSSQSGATDTTPKAPIATATEVAETTPKEGGAKSPTLEPVKKRSVSDILDPVYVAGHLGNYATCPEKGFSPKDEKKAAAAPSTTDSSEPPIVAGDAPSPGATAERGRSAMPMRAMAKRRCKPGGCAPRNCEPAQATIQLTNKIDKPITGIEIAAINLLDSRGEVATELPILATNDASTNKPFGGTLEPGKSVTLRIDFQGPRDLKEFDSALDNRRDAAKIKVIVGADDAEDAEAISAPIEPKPHVVT